MKDSRKHDPKFAFSRNGFHSTFTCAAESGMKPDTFRKWAKKHGVAHMKTKNPLGHGCALIWRRSDVRKLISGKTPVQQTLDFNKGSSVSDDMFSVGVKDLFRQIKEKTGCTKVVLEF